MSMLLAKRFWNLLQRFFLNTSSSEWGPFAKLSVSPQREEQQCILYLLSTHRSNHPLRQSLELPSLLELNAFANSYYFTEASYPAFCFQKTAFKYKLIDLYWSENKKRNIAINKSHTSLATVVFEWKSEIWTKRLRNQKSNKSRPNVSLLKSLMFSLSQTHDFSWLWPSISKDQRLTVL